MEPRLFLSLFVSAYIAVALCKWALVRVNISHIRKEGDRIPAVFQGVIDSETLSRMSRYTIESSRFGSAESLIAEVVLLAVLLSGIVPWMVVWIEAFHLHPVASGLVFFAVLAFFSTVFGIPFDLYSTFVIEKKYGFSTITAGLWISDFFKSLLISGALLVVLMTPLLALIYYAEKTWWIWGWMFLAVFQILMMWLYPVVIAPLFNKYEPIRDESLKEKITALAGKAGFRVKGVYQVDEGKRSRHSNAYFTGIGKSRRIVLFDTLISSHSHEEILSVLAHEIGHWKKKHIRKQIIALEALSLALFYLAWLLLDRPLLYSAFGLGQKSFYAGIFLLGVVLRTCFFFLTPIGSVVSRRFEREADVFAFSLTGAARPLADALKRLAKDNLANLHPHPAYAWFYYSHPPLASRIETLQELDAGKK